MIAMKPKFYNSLILAASILLCWIVPSESLAYVVVDGIYYNLNNQARTAEVTRKNTTNGYSGDVVIPESFVYNGNTYIVTSIGEMAFNEDNKEDGVSGLTSVTIPNSVIRIEFYAFGRCRFLTSVTIPNADIEGEVFVSCESLTSVTIGAGVSSIGGEAFAGCSSLTSITVDVANPYFDSRDNCNAIIETSTNTLIHGCKNTVIPNSVTAIGDYAFSFQSGLTSVDIPNGVTSIGFAAFRCTGLTSVTIPNSVTSIGEDTFDGCTGLTSVNIPNSVTSIGWSTFRGCTGLTSVEIPNSVTSIGSGAFTGCTGLASITVEWTTPLAIESSIFENVDKSNCTLYVPAGTKTAYENAEGWSEFENIVEPSILATGSCGDNVTYTIYSDMSMVISGTGSISSDANYKPKFPYHQSIKRVIIEEGLTSISYGAFCGCIDLISITIPSSVSNIGNFAFRNCTSLTSITIPGNVSTIGVGAIQSCNSLTSLTIGNGVKTIQDCAFCGCSSLTSVVIPSSVTEIEVFDGVPFGHCPNLTAIIVDANNETYDSRGNCNAIIKTSTNTLVEGCRNTVIPSSVTEIGSFAFSGVELTSVDIPNSVNKIGYAAFEDCTGLTALNIPSSVTDIEMLAFVGCTGLSSITIPKSVTSIGERVFELCASLNTIIVDVNNETYDSRDNCNAIIETSTNTLIAGCKNTLIPNSVTSIGKSAFSGCTGLASVEIPNSVTSIGYSAFWGCTGLTSIEIPNSVTSIGDWAFYGCTGLTSVDIPSSVTSIGGVAFESCTGLTSVTVEWTTPLAIESSVFSNVDKSNCTLYVPFGSKSAYEITEYWSDFENIEESPVLVGNLYYQLNISDNTAIVERIADKNYSGSITIPESIECAGNTYTVTEIGYYAFDGCTGLTSIDIPNSVTSIGGSAFQDCTGLTSIEIPNSVTSIFGAAFYGCTSLISVVLPNSFPVIDMHTFQGCTSLTSVDIPNSVKIIGMCAFNRCSSLISMTIPNSVTHIDEGAFYGCTGLTSIDIPNSVIEIGSEAFEDCTGLTSITVEHDTPISLPHNAFENVDKSNCTLHVPAGTKTAYENAQYWSEFENIVEIENVEDPDTDLSVYDNVVYIEGTEAFVGQQIRLSLKMNNTIAPTGFQCDVYLPDGVTAAQDEDGFYLMDISEERTTSKKTDYVSSVLQPDGGLRFMCSSTRSYTFSGNEGEVAYLMVDIDPNMEEGTYPLILRDVKISDANANAYRVEYVKTTLTIHTYTIGDANNDGDIDVADFTAIANYILGTPPATFVEKAADVNVDDEIDVADLTGVANIILYGTVSPNASHAKARNDVASKYANIGAKDVVATTDKEFTVAVNIDGNYAYSGYQFDMTLPEGMTVKNVEGQTKASDVFMSGMIDDNTLRVLCASTMGETTESTVVNLTLVADREGTYSIDIDNAIVSVNASSCTMSNCSFLVGIDNDATGISSLNDEASSNDVVYDLTGRKLMSNGNKSSLQKGIYIINGKKITK